MKDLIHSAKTGKSSGRSYRLLPALIVLLLAMQPYNLPAAGFNADSLFAEARRLARSGQREDARAICRQVLDKKPGYHDVRTYLARLFAWDKNYDAARNELKQVLAAKPKDRGALDVLADLEFWAGNLSAALKYSGWLVHQYPNNENFLFKNARLLLKAGDRRGAALALNRLLDRNPSHPEALKLFSRIKSSGQMNKLSVKYTYDNFDRGASNYGPWHLAVLDLSRRLTIGTLILRANYASRKFGSSLREGVQYEVEAYPKFMRGMYGYLSAAYSSDPVFPEIRAGGELFVSLFSGFEISAGVRHLRFSQSEATIFTGSLGKYYRNYWISFRPYISDKSGGISFSGNLIVRLYRGNADNYLELSMGSGSSPVDVKIEQEYQRLNSRKLSLKWQHLLGKSLILKWGGGYEYEEYRVNNFGKRFTLDFDLEKRF